MYISISGRERRGAFDEQVGITSVPIVKVRQSKQSELVLERILIPN